MLLRRGRAVPTALLAALLLGGCTGGDPEPSPGPEVSESIEPSPTPSPSPTPEPEPVAAPEPPADLERTDEVGAAAAAEYFASLYSFTIQTGNLALWDSLSFSECEFCSGVRQDVIAARDEGERLSGGEISLSELVVLPRDELIGGYPVEASFRQEPETRTDAQGAIVSATEGDSGSVRIDTLNVDGAWKILAVVVGDELK